LTVAVWSISNLITIYIALDSHWILVCVGKVEEEGMGWVSNLKPYNSLHCIFLPLCIRFCWQGGRSNKGHCLSSCHNFCLLKLSFLFKLFCVGFFIIFIFKVKLLYIWSLHAVLGYSMHLYLSLNMIKCACRPSE